MDDDYNSCSKSNLWLIILLVLGILLCLLIRSPEPTSPECDDKNCGLHSKTHKDAGINMSDQKWDTQKVLVREEKSPQNILSSSYDKLDPNINNAIEQLQKKALQAKRIIPHFPDFPFIWLLPPSDKGKYASLGERYCIEFLQLLFPNYTFTKVRPSWLKNPSTNRSLELDGFCPELMLAIEYNGIQHYVWPNFTGCTREQFFAQRQRDQIKEEICIRENICLIRIPYTITHERIPLAIYAKLLDAVPGLDF